MEELRGLGFVLEDFLGQEGFLLLLLLLTFEGLTEAPGLVGLCVVIWGWRCHNWKQVVQPTKTGFLGKALVATLICTAIGSELCVCSHVLVNNCLLSKALTTHTTFKRLLSCMLSHMHLQMCSLFKCLATVFTVKWPEKETVVSIK